MRKKSSGKDSSKSARSTKSASAPPRSSASKTSDAKIITKNFMKGLMTTDELMKKKEYENKGLVRLRAVLSPRYFMIFNPKMHINNEFVKIA